MAVSWITVISALSWMAPITNSPSLGLATTEGPSNSPITSDVGGFVHCSRVHGLKRLYGWISPPAHHRQSARNLVSPEQLLAFEPALPLAIQAFTGNQKWDARWVWT